MLMNKDNLANFRKDFEKAMIDLEEKYNIKIEISVKYGKKVVFLANDGSSGCEYEYETQEQLLEIIKDYIDDMIYYEIEEYGDRPSFVEEDEDDEEEIDVERCRSILKDAIDCSSFGSCGPEDVVEQLRNLNSDGEITDEEYDYIMENWDDLLNED